MFSNTSFYYDNVVTIPTDGDRNNDEGGQPTCLGEEDLSDEEDRVAENEEEAVLEEVGDPISQGEIQDLESSEELEQEEEEEEIAMAKNVSSLDGKRLMLPSIQYPWIDRKKQQRLTVDYLLPAGTSTNQVKVEVADCGRWLNLSYKAPQGLYDERRLLLANRNRGDLATLNASSSKVTAMAMAVQSYKNQFVNEEIVLTHREKLQFKCDANLCTDDLPTGCEWYPIRNEDEVMHAQYGQHYLIYSVDLVSVEKPKRTMVAEMNLLAFGSPSELGDNPDAFIAQRQRATMEASIMQQPQARMEQQQTTK